MRTRLRQTFLPRSAASGFTLIEIMIAVVVLGIVLLMLAQSFHTVAASKVHGENVMAVVQASRTIMLHMSDELRGAVQTPFTASKTMLAGRARMEHFVPMDTLLVSTLDPGHRRAIEDFGPEEIVEYTSAPNPDHEGWNLLMRRQYSALLDSPPSSFNDPPTLVANNVISLHLRYYDGTRWTESWDSENMAPGQALPQEVAIELVMGAPTGQPLTLSTVVMLPMAFQQW
ncbi:MAG TPA: type II secretion system protein GspJ [Candidatus Binataceae bacterium]|nr:type II secretion system protein GspJ [Candidatus Binataceae bacterium]